MTAQSDKLMTEVGYISLSFSNFDYLINEINSSLINIDNNAIGNYISGKLNTQARLDLYKKLLEIIPFPKPIVADAKAVLIDFIKIKQKRNELIHGIWHTKYEDEIPLDDFYIAKLNTSNWGDAQKIDVKELIAIKEKLQTLVTNQLQVNIDILKTYREIVVEKREKNKNLSDILSRTDSEESD